jgi:hypothetical protein
MSLPRALRRSRGKPRAVDPLEAFETNERFKRSLCYGQGESLAHAAAELGVSVRFAAAALPAGRELASVTNGAKRSLPPGAEILFALADYETKTVD